ncbi:MAG TPA: hypothetical protein VLJ38_07370 [Polyangiaceae bacterium]|nr:hypothetical protein [Polyangiaceae bacterium]
MRRARAERLAFRCLVLGIALAAPARAETAPCASGASVSPCFDADPLWIPTGPTPFATVPSARTLAPKKLSFVLAAGYSDRPVELVTPSPHPDGQEIAVVRATSTLTLGARYGLTRGIDLGIALPFVPFQVGSGADSVTTQQSEPLAAVALRDPRLELGATLFGRDETAPFALGTRLTVGVPLGSEHAVAGAATFTVAPGLTGALHFGRLELGADLGWRITRAVSFASVREGSAFTAALATSITLLEKPALALGAEAWLSAHVAGRPAGVSEDVVDLPAEWLATLRAAPSDAWCLLAAGGSGIPLSRVLDSNGGTSAALGVTSPDFRLLLLARYTLEVE